MANAGGRPILLDADHMDGFDKRLDMSPRSAARAYRNLLRGEDLLKCVRQEREDESEKWTAWQILQPKVADLRSPARASSARRRIAEKPQTPRRLQGGKQSAREKNASKEAQLRERLLEVTKKAIAQVQKTAGAYAGGDAL
eukprot:TRINITY_DN12360_c0_g1_i2.p1 TRINITY_DN12360_c0_g1~~TRINITY_DN12360_c0_g1_i2.p1  ORF type:complete len:141 (-),score=31.54 TRINITY_DN12360_c0_g1_i2:327-749(-)